MWLSLFGKSVDIAPESRAAMNFRQWLIYLWLLPILGAPKGSHPVSKTAVGNEPLTEEHADEALLELDEVVEVEADVTDGNGGVMYAKAG